MNYKNLTPEQKDRLINDAIDRITDLYKDRLDKDIDMNGYG